VVIRGTGMTYEDLGTVKQVPTAEIFLAAAAALVLLDREEGGRQAIEERGIPVYPLYTRTSLLGR
jgi:orotate phosphoribosyltransferase